MQCFVHYDWLLFAISHRCESLLFDAMLDEVVYDGLCTAELELLVVLVVAHKVGMRRHLDGDIGVVVE